MIKAAGILFRAGGRVLLLRRTGPDHEGEWCIPGGHIEKDETAEEAAVRETFEETGHRADDEKHRRRLWARSQKDGVDFTTFLQDEVKPFRVSLNSEHTAYEWADPAQPPQPMHPGAQTALDKLSWNELDIARAMSEGRLTSPQLYENIALFAVRLTGTGVAFRRALKEYVFRNPANYLTPDFLARCNGLPVIIDHPEAEKLDSDEFAQRIVGSVFLPYIDGEAVWAIIKVYDEAATKVMCDERLSTSPAVVFRDPSVNKTKKLDDGSVLLIEGVPSLLDHLAICEQGVWDKGGEPTGVASVTTTSGDKPVAEPNEELKADASTERADRARRDAEREEREERETAERDDRARRDAEQGQLLDKVLSRLDSLHGRLDALEGGKRDAEPLKEEPEIAEKKDGENCDPAAPENPSVMDGEMPEGLEKKMEQERADANARMDAARKDADDLRRKIADLERKMPKALSDKDYLEMGNIQAKADGVYSIFGDSAPRPLDGENTLMYRRRLAADMLKSDKVCDPSLKKLSIAGMSAEMLDFVEPQIYADAQKNGRNPTDLPHDVLREIVNTDPTGRRITTFAGKPSAWMGSFTANRRRMVGIRNGSR